MQLQLIIKQEEKTLCQHHVATGLTLGRDPSCDISLDHPMISRQQAQISQQDGHFYLEDLDSANGMSVDGSLVSKVRLVAGGKIQLPPFTIEVVALDNTGDVAREDNFINEPKSLAELLLDDPQLPSHSALSLLGEKTSQYDAPHTGEPTEIESVAASFNASTNPSMPSLPQSASAKGRATMLVPFRTAARLHPLNLQLGEPFFELDELQITIGRGNDCQLILPHGSVSQHHATLRKEANHYYLEDLNSTNGTRVNGDRIHSCVLHCHDVIEFGDIRLEYVEGAALPQARSNNVIEIAEDGELDGVTRKPWLPLLQRYTNEICAGLLFILAMLLIIPLLRNSDDKIAQSSTAKAALDLTAVSGQQPVDQISSERARIVAHQLQQARRLIQREKYQEAAVKVDLVLTKLDTHNLEATTMQEEIAQLLAMIEQEERTQQQQQRAQQRRKQELMSLAGEAWDAKRFREAKSLYRQVLGLDPNNRVAKENIVKISNELELAAQERHKRQAARGKIQETFTQGMIAYNANNFLQAAKYLRQVVAYPESQHYTQARIALDDVEERLLVEVEAKMSDAKDQYRNGRLVLARQLLNEVLSGDPKHQEAKTLKAEVLQEAREQAQQLYREAYTFEKLVQDYGAAKERYQKVLELLPEGREEYHRKARSRLNALD